MAVEKIKASLGSEGQSRGSGVMDHRGGEAWVEGLAPMERGNSEEQARLRYMDQ
jgi:hypothetical protein